MTKPRPDYNTARRIVRSFARVTTTCPALFALALLGVGCSGSGAQRSDWVGDDSDVQAASEQAASGQDPVDQAAAELTQAELDAQGTAAREPCALAREGCPCDAADDVTECGRVYRRSGDYVSCSIGHRRCEAGVWGECVGETTAELAAEDVPPSYELAAEAAAP